MGLCDLIINALYKPEPKGRRHMKIARIAVLATLVAVVFTQSVYADDDSGPARAVRGLVMSITTASREVELGSPITINVEVRNMSKHVAWIEGENLDCDYRLIVKDSKGRIVPPDSTSFGPPCSIYGTIRPSPLASNGSEKRPLQLDWYARFSKPGDYTVVAKAYVRKSAGGEMGRMREVHLTSNVLRLIVER